MTTALLTGATGFLGSHLLERLLADDWNVIATKRASSPVSKRWETCANLQWLEVGEIDHLEALLDGLPRIDAIFHLATAYGRSGESTASVVETNLMFPLRMLEAALRSGTQLFLHSDTCFTPEYPYLRTYTLSKRQFSQWGEVLCECKSLKFVNLVLQHPYGPGDRPGKFVPWIVEQCLSSIDKIPLTQGNQRKDFVFVEDVVEAIIQLWGERSKLADGFTRVECGSGIAVSIREFVELVHRVSNSQAMLEFGKLDYRPNEIMFSQADNRILNSLGWRPRCELPEGVTRTVTAHRHTG